MANWCDLSEYQRNYHLSFHPPPLVNNQPQHPGNNEFIPRCNPSLGEINAVLETGDTLVRTINYDLTMEQRDSITNWILVHGTDEQITLLADNILGIDQIIN